MSRIDKWINNNCKSLENKNVVILGATGSIGKETAKILSFLSANIYIAIRNKNKGDKLIEELKLIYPNNNYFLLLVDLSSKKSTSEFIKLLKDIKIDYFISCAGIYHLEKRLVNNLEIHFATNYYNQISIIESIKEDIKNNNAKIIVLGSISHRFSEIDFSDIMSIKTNSKTKLYGRSKRLFIIHLLSLIRKGYPISIVHPGVCPTTLFASEKGGFSKAFNKTIFPLMKLIFISPKKASLNIMYAIFNNIEYSYQVGPRGILHIWGFPKKYKFNKKVLSLDRQEKVISVFKTLGEKYE